MSGGGGGPSQTTTVTSNIPEYARPYVENMLEAGQRQLFDVNDGTISGFKPYSPYSTDPSQYFAGPSGLQQSTYQEASGMTTPGQYAPATGIAGLAGMGQLGAGAQYAAGVTSPSAVQAYMSPYQQAVTNVSKDAAVREAQMADKAARLGSVRQGTYGGARELLGRSERERNLLSNLSNIQAQGSQSAYDRAIQSQQFGANLGLQGLAGAASTAGTLGQLGGAQQQADIARMELQNKLGGQQQQYQQGIINQAIQDYATAQQYPYMQLSTMSNLLRGLPMQGMSTQQYQAQPSTTQQLLGLAGTGASLYGAMKREGGTIKEYAAGGGVRASLENKIDDIAETGGAKGLQSLLAQTKSPQAKQMIIDRMREEGITAAPSGLGRNMAGGGIIAFGDGGDVPGYYDGDLIDGFGTSPEAMAMDQMRVDEAQLAEKRKRYEQVKAMSPVAAERMLAEDPNLEVRAPVVAPAAAPAVKKDNAPSAAPAAAPSTTATTTRTQSTGLDAILEDRRRRLGIDGPGEKSEAFMKALEERQAGMGKEREADRYLRMAEAFSKFGSTAGPIGVAASEALGGFAKGEAAARRDEDKMKLEGMKMQADLEKARRAEARGDLDAAEKFYNSAEDRKNRLDASKIAASASGQTAQLDRDAIAQVMKDNPGMTYLEALQAVRGAGRAETTLLQNQKAVLASLDAQILTAKKEDKAALMRKRDEIYNQMLKTSSGSGAPGKVIDFSSIK